MGLTSSACLPTSDSGSISSPSTTLSQSSTNPTNSSQVQLSTNFLSAFSLSFAGSAVGRCFLA